MSETYSDIVARIGDRMQRHLPMVARPFLSVSEELGLDENTVLTGVTTLKKDGVIRTIAGIFDATRLGFFSSLVAFKVSEQHIETAVKYINTHPGVSHNYLRDHEYNLWFTLMTPDRQLFDKTVQHLARKAGTSEHLVLANEELYKIGVHFDIGEGTADTVESSPVAGSPPQSSSFNPMDRDIQEALRLLQYDLPLVSEPFLHLIRENNSFMTLADLLHYANTLHNLGIMRRYSAIVRHYRAGYQSNAMTVWRPRDLTHLHEIIDIFKTEPSISHLYRRTVFPGRWEYPLFAMIHAKYDHALDAVITRLAEKSAIGDYRVLRSLAEFKKQRVRLSLEEFNDWNTREGII